MINFGTKIFSSAYSVAKLFIKYYIWGANMQRFSKENNILSTLVTTCLSLYSSKYGRTVEYPYTIDYTFTSTPTSYLLEFLWNKYVL